MNERFRKFLKAGITVVSFLASAGAWAQVSQSEYSLRLEALSSPQEYLRRAQEVVDELHTAGASFTDSDRFERLATVFAYLELMRMRFPQEQEAVANSILMQADICRGSRMAQNELETLRRGMDNVGRRYLPAIEWRLGRALAEANELEEARDVFARALPRFRTLPTLERLLALRAAVETFVAAQEHATAAGVSRELARANIGTRGEAIEELRSASEDFLAVNQSAARAGLDRAKGAVVKLSGELRNGADMRLLSALAVEIDDLAALLE